MATSILALQNAWADGETLPSAWLEVVADNVEYARFGYISIDVAGGAGDTTLNVSTQANRKVIVFTGALTGNRGIILPANAGQEWLLVNDTSGAFTLTAKVSGQTGIVITQGYRARAWCDGTDIRRGSLDYSNAGLVQITGGTITGIVDLAIADGGTGASSAGAARTNLGLGTAATQAQAAADANDSITPSAGYVQAEIVSIVDELHDLKDKLRTAGLIAP